MNLAIRYGTLSVPGPRRFFGLLPGRPFVYARYRQFGEVVQITSPHFVAHAHPSQFLPGVLK